MPFGIRNYFDHSKTHLFEKIKTTKKHANTPKKNIGTRNDKKFPGTDALIVAYIPTITVPIIPT
jgi:hypothetical protein